MALSIPFVTAAPNEDARAFPAFQGSATRKGELMVCVEIDSAQSRAVFMLPLHVATKLRDNLVDSLEELE